VDAVELDVGDLVVVDEHGLVGDEEEALVEWVEEALDGLHRTADALGLVVEGAAVEAARLDLLHLFLRKGREDLGEDVGHVAALLQLELVAESPLQLVRLEVERHLARRLLRQLEHQVRVGGSSLAERVLEGDDERHVVAVLLWQQVEGGDVGVEALVVEALAVQLHVLIEELDVVPAARHLQAAGGGGRWREVAGDGGRGGGEGWRGEIVGGGGR
jgi:hypothetical protein